MSNPGSSGFDRAPIDRAPIDPATFDRAPMPPPPPMSPPPPVPGAAVVPPPPQKPEKNKGWIIAIAVMAALVLLGGGVLLGTLLLGGDSSTSTAERENSGGEDSGDQAAVESATTTKASTKSQKTTTTAKSASGSKAVTTKAPVTAVLTTAAPTTQVVTTTAPPMPTSTYDWDGVRFEFGSIEAVQRVGTDIVISFDRYSLFLDGDWRDATYFTSEQILVANTDWPGQNLNPKLRRYVVTPNANLITITGLHESGICDGDPPGWTPTWIPFTMDQLLAMDPTTVRGNQTSLTFDAAGRVTQIRHSDGC